MKQKPLEFGSCSLLSEDVFPLCSFCVVSELITSWHFVLCSLSQCTADVPDLSVFTVKLQGSISPHISRPDI